MKRRDFLKKAIKVFFSFLTLAFLPVLVYMYPSNIKTRKRSYIYLMDEEDLPRKGVRRLDIEYASEERSIVNRVYLAVTDKGLTAFSSVCTHLGCLVNWDNNKKEFLCPCHGGKYNINGDVTGGPPPNSLTRLPLEIRDGKVYIGITV